MEISESQINIPTFMINSLLNFQDRIINIVNSMMDLRIRFINQKFLDGYLDKDKFEMVSNRILQFIENNHSNFLNDFKDSLANLWATDISNIFIDLEDSVNDSKEDVKNQLNEAIDNFKKVDFLSRNKDENFIQDLSFGQNNISFNKEEIEISDINVSEIQDDNELNKIENKKKKKKKLVSSSNKLKQIKKYSTF